MGTVDGLLNALRISDSGVILGCLTSILCREDGHMAEGDISRALAAYCRGLGKGRIGLGKRRDFEGRARAVWANPTEASRSVQSSARLVRAFFRPSAAASLPLGRAGVPAHLEATPPCLRPKKEPSLRTRRGLALTY